jgi:PAS domain S-box-containing protein
MKAPLPDSPQPLPAPPRMEFASVSASPIHQAIADRMISFTKVASICAAAVGPTVLLGWFLSVQILKSIQPGLSTMKPNSAICLALLGASLWLLAGHSLRLDKIQSQVLGIACAAMAGLVSGATFSEYLFGWNLRIDQVLFHDAVMDRPSLPGRMAPHTALAFLLLACALLLITVETKRGFRPAQVLALFPAFISFVAMAGYLYSVVSFYRIASYTGMALHTAVAIFLLSLGVLFTPPDRGIAAIVSSDGLGGIVARRLLLPAFFIPIALGWIRMEGQKAGLYGTEFGLALMVTTSVLIFSVLIYFSAVQVQQVAEARHTAEQGALELNYTLKALVDAFPLPVITLDSDAKVRIWNAATEQVFGWSWMQVIGRSNPLVPGDKLAEYQTILEVLESGDTVAEIETELCTRDDIRIPVSLWAAPIEIGRRGFSGSIVIIRDTSEQKRLELQLRQSMAAIANRQLNPTPL